MFPRLKKASALAKAAYSKWQEHKATRMAAALSYYTVFSIVPLLLIIIAIAGLVFGQSTVRAEVVGQIERSIGTAGAQIIDQALQHAGEPFSGWVATIVGFIMLLLGAAGAFSELQDALNTIWEVRSSSRKGILRNIVAMVQERLVSFGMVVGMGGLLLVSLALSTSLAALSTSLSGMLPGIAILAQIADFLLSLVILTLLFATLYKVLPDARVPWGDVWLGATVTALLFTVGKLGLSFYLSKVSIGSVYGAPGALLVVLVWIYYSAQLVLFGAELTRAYTEQYGAHSAAGRDSR